MRYCVLYWNMKKLKISISLILILSLLLSLASCSKEQRVEYCELGIVLTDDFTSYDSDGAFNVAYSDGKVIVGIARYSFVNCEELGLLSTYTPNKLANVYLEMMARTVDESVNKHGDVPYFSYTETAEDGSQFFYMPTFYRTPYAYFVITFITPKSREDEGRAEFFKYMESVYILKEYL